MAIEAAGGLDPERYVPHLIVTRSTGPLEQLVRERGVRVTILERRRGFSPRKLTRALRIVRASAVVHAHQWGSGMWGALLARLARRPLIAHVQRYDAAVARGWLSGYRLWIGPTASKIACVSDEIAAAFATAGLPQRKLAVVPNGVAVGAALAREDARAALGLDVDAVVVGIVARLRAEKRHDRALRALALLRQQGRKVSLAVVGSGPEEERLRDLERELDLADAVHWAGAIDNAGQLVLAFDVLLLCSDIEGMPLAVLEALVEGVPVVATAVDALPGLLADGGGILVDTPTPARIAAALSAVLDRAAVDANAARVERARARYSNQRVTRDVERLYDEALGLARDSHVPEMTERR